MAVQQRLYDIDDLWQLVCQADNNDKHFELIDGELFEMSPPGWEHGTLASEIAFHIRLFDRNRTHGILTLETGFYPVGDRGTLLSPDVAFTRMEKAPERAFKKWAPLMPDLAVQIISPSNSMAQVRRKAAVYLQHGTQLVWVVIPDRQGVEVLTLDDEGKFLSEFIGIDGALSGEQVLPGFELDLSCLFSRSSA